MENQLPSNRAMSIGCGVMVLDAAQTNSAVTDGIIKKHAPCSAVENITTGALTVGLLQAGSKLVVAITSIAAGAIKAFQTLRAFNLTSVTPTYSTRTMSFTGVASTHYIIKVLSVDTPAATTTLTVTSGKGTFVELDTGATSTVKTVTQKGINTYLFKCAAGVTDPSIVLGAGFSASTDSTTPSFSVHKITPWTIGQLNLIY